jgi:hypothetical protein
MEIYHGVIVAGRMILSTIDNLDCIGMINLERRVISLGNYKCCVDVLPLFLTL